MSEPSVAVEILDATDPVVTRRVWRIACEGKLGIHTVNFWYLCAELSAVATFGALVLLPVPWWAAVAVGAPGGVAVHVAGLWIKMNMRIGIKPGDKWYLLETPKGRALALVKTRNGHAFVAGAGADSIALSDELFSTLNGLTTTHRSCGYFVTPPPKR